jgi:hypothetical protein
MATLSMYTEALKFTPEVPGAAIHSEILQQLRIQCQHLIYSDGTNAWDTCDPDSEATFDMKAPIPEGSDPTALLIHQQRLRDFRDDLKVQAELLRNITKRCDPDDMQALYQKHPILKAEHILEYWGDNYSAMTPEAIAYIKNRDLRWDPTIDARKNIARHDRAHTILKIADTDKFMTLIDMTAQHP